MDLFELVEKLRNCTDEVEAYVLNSMIEELAKENKESLKPELENGELGATNFSELGRIFSLIETQKGTLDKDSILKELTDQEKIDNFDFTEKKLKDMGHKDLIDKFKTVTPVRQIRVTTIKTEIA